MTTTAWVLLAFLIFIALYCLLLFAITKVSPFWQEEGDIWGPEPHRWD